MWPKTEFCEIYLLKQNFYLKKLQTAAVAAQEGGACGEVKGAGEGECMIACLLVGWLHLLSHFTGICCCPRVFCLFLFLAFVSCSVSTFCFYVFLFFVFWFFCFCSDTARALLPDRVPSVSVRCMPCMRA